MLEVANLEEIVATFHDAYNSIASCFSCCCSFYLLPAQGTSISSTMGVILSLLPPFVLSVTSWGFKRKLLI